MSGLVIAFGPVHNAVEQWQRIGEGESRQQVVNRVLADIRAGHHPFVPPMDELERRQQQGAVPSAQEGAR